MLFGENTRNSQLTIGTSDVLVSPARYRQELILTNISSSSQIIYISFGQTSATSTSGIYLLPYACYYATASQNFKVSSEEIHAIASAGSATIAVFER